MRTAPVRADFVYSEYLMSGNSAYRSMVWQIAEDYACADLLLRLPGYAPMPAFGEVHDVPLVVRHARKTKQQV
jgi:L-arabinokinase